MNMVNIITQSTITPDRMGGVYNPDRATLLANGWRDMPAVPPVADGYERVPITYVDGADGQTAVAVYTDTPIADRLSRERAERLATLPTAQAAAFRFLLRKHFGDGAETNREITAEAVTAYFASKPNITADEVRDGVLLRELFGVLSAWTGTGETWSIPWEVLP